MNKCTERPASSLPLSDHCLFFSLPAPLQSTPLRAAPSSLTLDLSSLVQSLPDQHITAKFLVVGLTNDDVSRACRELHQAYESHCSSYLVSQEELKHFTPAEVDDIINNVTSLGIQISQCGPDGLQVSGLTKRINEFTHLIQAALVRQVCSRFVWNSVI